MGHRGKLFAITRNLSTFPIAQIAAACNYFGVSKTLTQKTERRAYTVAEFSRMAGKSRDWGYRLVAKNLVRTIDGYGPRMIPAAEVDRIFGKHTEGAGVPEMH